MKDTGERFSQILKDEILKPFLTGISFIKLRDILLKFADNIRFKQDWPLPPDHLISRADVQQQEVDVVVDMIYSLIERYRQKRMSTQNVTENAAKQVVNKLRDWVKRKYWEGTKFKSFSDPSVESLFPALFHPSAEKKTEIFDHLLNAGVIDFLEYYLLFAAYHGETTLYAARLINMREGSAHKTLERARVKVQECTDNLGDGSIVLLVPKPIEKRRRAINQRRQATNPRRQTIDKRRRIIDEELLKNAIIHILGRSV